MDFNVDCLGAHHSYLASGVEFLFYKLACFEIPVTIIIFSLVVSILDEGGIIVNIPSKCGNHRNFAFLNVTPDKFSAYSRVET
jgi:hypothetical protein